MTSPDAGTPAENTLTPELSVIIPAYNAADTLSLQLEALLVQQPPFAYEILICDNGSTDATEELVHEWSVIHPIVRLVDASARRGPAAARNIGAAVARAPLLAFCDADDMVGEGWLTIVRSALQQYGFVAGSFDFKLLNGRNDIPGLWTAQSERLTNKPYLPQLVVAGSGNMGVERAIFEEVGGFFEQLKTAEDDDFCLRVQLSGHTLAYVPELVLHVRRREGVVALCKQAYAYAAGERRLAYRYSAYAKRNTATRPDDSPSNEGASRNQPPGSDEESTPSIAAIWATIMRIVSKLRRTRRLTDLAAVAWRWSWRLGWRLTREDGRIPRVEPSDPSTLIVRRV